MNETIKTLIERRSVRSYNNKKVPKEAVEQIVLAGEYAPSGMGKQQSKIVVVENEKEVSLLSKLNAKVMGTDSDPFYGAKTVIVVFSNSESHTCVEDGSLIMGNLMNAAHSLGVCSCWIHRAKEVFEFVEGKKLKQKWEIPESYVGIGHCIIGYTDDAIKQAADRKSDYVVYSE